MIERIRNFFRRDSREPDDFADRPRPKRIDLEAELKAAGFVIDRNDSDYQYLKDLLVSQLDSRQMVQALAACLPTPELKTRFIDSGYQRYGGISEFLMRLRALIEHGRSPERIEEILSNISEVMCQLSGLLDDDDRNRIDETAMFLIEVFDSEKAFALFGNSREEIVQLIESWSNNIWSPGRALRLAAPILNNPVFAPLLAEGGATLMDRVIEEPVALRSMEKRPDLVEIAAKAIRTGMTWPARLEALDAALATTVYGQISDDELNEALLRQYATQMAVKQIQSEAPELANLTLPEFWKNISLRDPKCDSLAARYVSYCLAESLKVRNLPASERFSLLVSLRQRIPDTSMLKIRMALANTTEHKGYAQERKAALVEAMRRAALKEHPRHPANSLRLARYSGYELEYRELDGKMLDQLGPIFGSKFVDFIGFSQGGGGIGESEFSPGPFRDPKTGIVAFRLLNQASVIDLFAEYGLTFHFNAELESNEEDEVAPLVWTLYATGAIYGPEFSDVHKVDFGEEEGADEDEEEGESLRIYNNSSRHGDYIECKTFDVLTPHGFEWGYEGAASLVHALGAYQDVAKESQTRHPDKNQIHRAPVDKYRKRLARIWLRHDRRMAEGFAVLGFKRYFRETWVPLKAVHRLEQEIDKVYPTQSSRYLDRKNVTEGEITVSGQKLTVPTIPIRTKEGTWPNIVAFATAMVDRVREEVNAVFDALEADVQSDISQIEACSEEGEKLNLICEFVDKYQVDLPEEADVVSMVRAYQEVRSLFENKP